MFAKVKELPLMFAGTILQKANSGFFQKKIPSADNLSNSTEYI